MFDRIIRLSLDNSVFVNLLFFLIIAAGLRSVVKLPREQFPEISLDRVIITTIYPGATAEDVEELVTKPIEEALQDVGDVERINSISSEGTSNIYVTFVDGTDLVSARSEVEKAVGTVDDLPEDCETPIVKELMLELPVVSLALLGDPGATVLVDRLADELRDLPGVAQVLVSGLSEQKIFVDLHERELQALGLAPSAVVDAIRRAHANVPAGTVELSGQDVFVKTEKRLLSAADVAEVPVYPGSSLRVGDIADVKAVAEPADTRFWVDGVPAVKLTISREETADPLRIHGAVLAELPRLRSMIPPGLDLRMADDYTKAIADRLSTVGSNAISGAILVILVLLVMSGFRQAMLAAVGMPVAFLAAAFLMDQTGMSINVVSTFALLIATGIIVDDAIVVIENVQRHLEMGKGRSEATFEGTREVLLPVIVAVLTTCLAFLPLTMVSGTMGRVMRILPLVVVFCLLGSLLETIFILPGHTADFASTDAQQSYTARLLERMKRWYRLPLSWCVRHRYATLGLVTLGFAGTVGLATTMPLEFGAPAKPFELEVHYEVMPGLDRERTRAEADAIDGLVREFMADRIETTSIRVGSIFDKENGFTSTGANMGQIRWEFALDEEMLAAYPEMALALRKMLAENPELGRFAIKEMQAGPPAGAAVTARIRGRDIDALNRAVSGVKTALYGMAGVKDIRDDYGSGKETFRVVVDQDRASFHGLTELDVGQAVRLAVDGVVAAEVSIQEEPTEIVVRYAGARGKGRGALGDLLMPTPAGHLVRLDQVARIERTREAGFVRREDGLRTVSVLADVDQEVITAFEAARRLQKFWDDELQDRYPDLGLSFGGEADELRESLEDLPGAFGLAILLIYLVLALQFRSYVQPLIILSAVPFGLMGAILGLVSMGYALSLIALFGIVALAGIVVNDSLVMVDFINRLRERGQSTVEATIEGALTRLRPILSTTLTTCLGLFPLAVGLGGEDPVFAPMAMSICAGLAVSTILVLLVVPPLYLVVEDVRGAVRRRLGRGRGTDPD